MKSLSLGIKRSAVKGKGVKLHLFEHHDLRTDGTPISATSAEGLVMGEKKEAIMDIVRRRSKDLGLTTETADMKTLRTFITKVITKGIDPHKLSPTDTEEGLVMHRVVL